MLEDALELNSDVATACWNSWPIPLAVYREADWRYPMSLSPGSWLAAVSDNFEKAKSSSFKYQNALRYAAFRCHCPSMHSIKPC
jgi:hypothetical protein